MRMPTLKLYRDKRGEWRWRLRAPNGKIVADSAEGYKTRRGARIAMVRAQVMMMNARVTT